MNRNILLVLVFFLLVDSTLAQDVATYDSDRNQYGISLRMVGKCATSIKTRNTNKISREIRSLDFSVYYSSQIKSTTLKEKRKIKEGKICAVKYRIFSQKQKCTTENQTGILPEIQTKSCLAIDKPIPVQFASANIKRQTSTLDQVSIVSDTGTNEFGRGTLRFKWETDRTQYEGFFIVSPQDAGYASDETHIEFMPFNRLKDHIEAIGFHIEKQYSFPFPRFVGKFFKYNEFVVVARSYFGK